jgi:hypothetical protein
VSGDDHERELAIHQQAVAKAAAEAEQAARREGQRREVEAEAERFAEEHGMVTPEPVVHESPLERWRHLGGLQDPEAASRILSDPAKRSGIRVASYDDLAIQRAAEATFYAHGGGRLPHQQGPAPMAPQRPRLSMDWINDADVIYDAASLAMIAASRRPSP